uniref:SH2 domain-containing protein n=1 Tax=Oncorhynchus tshawytscha TaxID=74940 RepID=A0AAZ3PKQ7_ONCTS
RNFPDWFQGFTTRKGQDRCRHFVINQDQAGLFAISGDDQPHHSLTELIEHYRVHPIQPFGESLTSTYCCQSSSGELYDVVQFETKEKKKTGGVSVRALRSYWDQQNEQKNDQHQQNDHQKDHHNDPRNEQHQWNDLPPTRQPPAVPPVLPPKTNNRKLTSTVSIGRKSLPQQAVPPVPRRGPPLTHSLSGTLSDKRASQTQYAEIHHDHNKTTSHGQTQYAEIHANHNKTTSHGQTQYAEIHHDQTKTKYHGQTQYAEIHTNQNKVERLASTGSLNQRRSTGPWSSNNTSTAAGGVMYSELTLPDGRSRSLPRLDDATEEEEEGYSDRITIPCFPNTSHFPNPPKRVTCHAYSLQDPRESPRPQINGGPQSLDQLSTNPLYQASVGLGEGRDTPWKVPQKQREGDRGRSPQDQTTQQEESMYAEVPEGPSPPRHLITDNTYEQIPGDGGLKRTQSTATDQEGNTYEMLENLKSKESTWGKKNSLNSSGRGLYKVLKAFHRDSTRC